MKLRMLLKAADCDPGLIEMTPYKNAEAPAVLTRIVDRSTVRDVDPETGEVFHEYVRGVMSISLTFVADGQQTSSFNDVEAWVTEYFHEGGRGVLDITIERASE